MRSFTSEIVESVQKIKNSSTVTSSESPMTPKSAEKTIKPKDDKVTPVLTPKKVSTTSPPNQNLNEIAPISEKTSPKQSSSDSSPSNSSRSPTLLKRKPLKPKKVVSIQTNQNIEKPKRGRKRKFSEDSNSPNRKKNVFVLESCGICKIKEKSPEDLEMGVWWVQCEGKS